MKSILAVIAIFLTLPVFAQDKTQNFYVADEGQLFIEGGYTFTNSQYELKGASDEEYSQTQADLAGQYGVSAYFNLGLELSHTTASGWEGVNDYRLFLKGQHDIFLYGLNYFYSHEDMTEDNATSGGSHYSVDLGIFKNSFGAVLSHRPEYRAKHEDGDSWTVGSETIVEGFYEANLGDNAFGAGIGRSMREKDENNQHIVYNYLKGYGAFGLGQLTLLPALRYSLLSNKLDGVDSVSITTLELRARYAF